MKPVYQEEHGECLRACIASIFELELEAVPVLHTLDDEVWYGVYRNYVRTFGVDVITIDTSKGVKVCGDLWVPPGYHIISGPSPRGDFHHAIVGYQGKPVHDPCRGGNCELKAVESWDLFVASLYKLD